MSKQKEPQIHVRLPEDLKDELSELANHERWTMNQAIIEAIKLLIAKRA